jgi:hypothetical protein
MKRFYYMSDSLDELEQFEHDLESRGIPRTQIYLLSNDEVGLESHDVNRVASFLRTDVIHSGEIGALFGLVLAAAILLTANLSGIVEQTTWVPFIFLAIVAFGFSTWEGGFIGMQGPNTHFTKFEKALDKGLHVLFVETDKVDKKKLKKVVKKYPKLKRAGTEVTHTGLLMFVLRNWEKFRSRALVFKGRPKAQEQ